MKSYRLTPTASEDLEAIVRHIAADSPRNALKVFDTIHAAARRIAAMPGIGHFRPDVTKKPVKFWSVYSWLLVYRADREPIEIIRIVHGMRDLREALKHDDLS